MSNYRHLELQEGTVGSVATNGLGRIRAKVIGHTPDGELKLLLKDGRKVAINPNAFIADDERKSMRKSGIHTITQRVKSVFNKPESKGILEDISPSNLSDSSDSNSSPSPSPRRSVMDDLK
jgi:hypothetical protein